MKRKLAHVTDNLRYSNITRKRQQQYNKGLHQELLKIGALDDIHFQSFDWLSGYEPLYHARQIWSIFNRPFRSCVLPLSQSEKTHYDFATATNQR